jgi:putative flippase GtrA
MAVPTGSGTETLHSHSFDNTDSVEQTLIFGVQHHVYTVLSMIIYCNVLNATTDYQYLFFKGHDGHAGVSGAKMYLARFVIQVGETYVWNDKFSFNGVEPTGTNVMSASEQIAVAAQSGSAVQKIMFGVTHATDDVDVICTYLDQDWT